MGKFSPDLIPRPPLTTVDALPRSGRSDFETDSLTHSALSNATTSLTVSTESAGQSTNGALSKLVGRIDNTFVPVSFDITFPRTFPAYIGRTYVFSSSMSRMSVTGETSRSAAARGTMELPNLDDVPTTTLQSLDDATAWMAAATVSPTTCFWSFGSILSPATWYTFEIPSGIFVGACPPTTSKSIDAFPNFCAAVTVDCVPAGVAPPSTSGSDTTNVDAQQRADETEAEEAEAVLRARRVAAVLGNIFE
mmetsp:Transcript_54485/g.132243  ORF Transcript_54485/g.132243 Transcript_54485/m.132243 type:complete len:250 (-) Transcript_54485:155-904(-)